MFKLKKVLRSLKNRREVVLELNDTNTAAEMVKTDLKRKASLRSSKRSSRFFFGSSKRLEAPTNLAKSDQTIYENFPRTNVTTTTSACCSQFSDGSSVFGEDLKPAIYQESSVSSSSEEVEDDLAVPSCSRTSFVPGEHSFAINPQGFASTEPSVIGSGEDMEKMVSQFFGTSLESIESTVQSSVEAYNEFVRIKHTIFVIQKMCINDSPFMNAPSELMQVYLNGLLKSLGKTMRKLEREYPGLHTYARKRGMDKFKATKLDTIGEDVVEYEIM